METKTGKKNLRPNGLYRGKNIQRKDITISEEQDAIKIGTESKGTLEN